MKQSYLYKKKKFNKIAERKRVKRNASIVIGFGIFGILYWWFGPTVIGHDPRYSLYVFWLPTLLGIVAFGIYRRKFLVHEFSQVKSFIDWSLLPLLFLAEGLMCSYLIFGQVSLVTWDYLNLRTANQHHPKELTCPVLEFSPGSGSRHGVHTSYIYFDLNGEREDFKLSKEMINEYRDKDPNYYCLKIKAREGIWGYYKVDSWVIRNKE